MVYNFILNLGLLLVSIYTVGFFIWMNRVQTCLELKEEPNVIKLKLKVFAWFWYFKELKEYLNKHDIKLTKRNS